MLGETVSLKKLRGERADSELPAAITDIGCERDINEDRYAVVDSGASQTWIVCDGMGGTLGGELAAQLAIDAIRRGLESRKASEPAEVLIHSVEEANRIIVLRRQNPTFSGMGTTVVAASIASSEVVIAHAGDSRAYLVRDGIIQQLTVDHTYVQDLVEKGAISEQEALSHPQAHVLTRCLGAEPRIKLDVQNLWVWPTESGQSSDNLVLCSDGLYSLVSNEEIAEVVSRKTPQESCAELVDLAKQRGGYDNITLSVIPLDGRLRDEAPQKSLGGITSRMRVEKGTSSIPLGKQLVIMSLLLVLGFLVTVFAMFVQLID